MCQKIFGELDHAHGHPAESDAPRGGEKRFRRTSKTQVTYLTGFTTNGAQVEDAERGPPVGPGGSRCLVRRRLGNLAGLKPQGSAKVGESTLENEHLLEIIPPAEVGANFLSRKEGLLLHFNLQENLFPC